MNQNPHYSIILPVYNQEKHLESLFLNYTVALDQLDKSFELIIVVNGSSDKSYSKALELAESYKMINVFNIDKGGWGRAVKYGISKAKGECICYTNSARTNVSDLINMLKYASIDNEFVIKASRIIRESFMRKFGSMIFNLEYRLLFHLPIFDVNGTPKIFHRNHIEKIDNIFSENDLIDAEIIARCFHNNIKIIEYPVFITKRFEGKSTTNYSSALKMYWGLIKLKFKLRKFFIK